MNRKLFALIATLAILLSACSTAEVPATAANFNDAVNTAVAQTQAAAKGALPSSTPAPSKAPTTTPVPPTAKPLPTNTATPVPATSTAINTSTAPASVLTISKFADVATFEITGAPDRVDKSVVLRAQGDDGNGNHFDNATGLGTEMMLAEPGSILYGPDEPASVVKANPSGAYLSGDNQHFLGTDTWSDNVAEGAFQFASGARMTIEVHGFTITVESTAKTCSNNWHVFIRGLFKDGKQDSDRNSTSHYSSYIAGHTEIMDLPVGAYISEGWRDQNAAASHQDFRNCGAEGTSGLSELYLDLNTGAWLVLYQPNLGQPWQLIDSNWQ